MKKWHGAPSLRLSGGMNSPERSLAVMELRMLSCWSAEASILPLLLEQTEPELSTRPSASSTNRSMRSLQGQKNNSSAPRYDWLLTIFTSEWTYGKLTLHQDSCWTSFFQTGFAGQRSQSVRTSSTCSKTQRILPQFLCAPWEKQ